jgi:hypothetical protein
VHSLNISSLQITTTISPEQDAASGDKKQASTALKTRQKSAEKNMSGTHLDPKMAPKKRTLHGD